MSTTLLSSLAIFLTVTPLIIYYEYKLKNKHNDLLNHKIMLNKINIILKKEKFLRKEYELKLRQLMADDFNDFYDEVGEKLVEDIKDDVYKSLSNVVKFYMEKK